MCSVDLKEKIFQLLDAFNFLELEAWLWGVDDSSARLIVVIVVMDKIFVVEQPRETGPGMAQNREITCRKGCNGSSIGTSKTGSGTKVVISYLLIRRTP